MKKSSFFSNLRERFSNITKKQYVILAFTTIILLFLLALAYTIKKKNEKIADKDREFKTWVDKNGNSHVKVEVTPVSKEERKRVYDSIANVLNQKPRTIIYYTKASAVIDTNLIIKRHQRIIHDTIPGPNGDTTFKDRIVYDLSYVDTSVIEGQKHTWMEIKGTVPQDPQRLSVKAEADLTFTKYFKKKWFLGPKTYYTDIGTNNPYLKFTGSTSYETTPSPTWKISPGIGLGIGYNPFTQKINPEIQAGVYLFRSK